MNQCKGFVTSMKLKCGNVVGVVKKRPNDWKIALDGKVRCGRRDRLFCESRCLHNMHSLATCDALGELHYARLIFPHPVTCDGIAIRFFNGNYYDITIVPGRISILSSGQADFVGVNVEHV